MLSLPWTIYAGWWRETSYGRTSQPLGDFLGQAALSTAITALVSALFMLGVYWLIRRTGKRWWIWSGALTAIVLAIVFLLSPVLIEPLFNKYEPVPPGQVRDAVVDMAGRAGIPPDKSSCSTARASRTISPPMPAASAARRGLRSPTSR